MMRTDKMKKSEPLVVREQSQVGVELEALRELEFCLDYLEQIENLIDPCLTVEGRASYVLTAWKKLKEVRDEK